MKLSSPYDTFYALRQRLSELLKTIQLGIRAKLAFFTGILIFLTILVFTWTAVRQQTRILAEGYEKQARMSRRHVSALVQEINNMARNLMQIETFRRQLEEQQRIRRAFRAQKTVEQEKELNLGLFKTNLFGALGKTTVSYKVDTFYSRYLSPAQLSEFENKVKAEIEKNTRQTLSAPKWLELKKLAGQLITEAKPEKIIKIRAALDQKIAALLIPSYRKVIEEIGLDQNLFRIQTFPITAFGTEQQLLPSFDTILLSPDGRLAQVPEQPELEESLKKNYEILLQTAQADLSENFVRLRYNDLYLQALYAPLFEKPISTRLSRSLLRDQKATERFHLALAADANLSLEIEKLVTTLRNRLKSLRDRKIAPYLDRDFRNLYSKYRQLTIERYKKFAELINLADSEKPLSLTEAAVLYLRDAGIEENILLYYGKPETNVEELLQTTAGRSQFEKRTRELRNWIMAATTETVPPALQRLYPNAMIGKSRSEAEEIMWEHDSKPLFTGVEAQLPRIILQNNLTSIMRTLVDETDGIEMIRKNREQVLLTAFLIALLAILLAVYFSGVVVQKIKRIIRSAEQVGKGMLDVEFEHGGHDEFGNLTDALNSMVSGLREREKIKGILGTMIDPVVVSEAMKDLAALKRGSEKEITAFFSDVASFSEISEKLPSPELANLLNEYLSAMTQILKKYEGVLDKYIGDAIVGIFNSPVDVTDHTLKAAQAAIEMQKRLLELREEWKQKNQYIPQAHQMKMRIGLNVGMAKVGFMGTDAIASYTMMGDTVNLAARLESAAKDYGVTILASEAVFEHIKDKIFCRKLDLVRVKGKEKPVALYEIICPIGEESAEDKAFVSLYEEGLKHYFTRHWAEAVEYLHKAEQVLNKEEKSCQLLIARCQYYQQNPPSENWDGVYTRTEK